MTQFTWAVNANGDWGTAADWTPSGPPTTGATVTISIASAHTMHLQQR